MYNIIFYKDKNNFCELELYLKYLQNQTDKESRIKFNKIIAYIKILSQYGPKVGIPYVKHIRDNIWELRPKDDRILFANLKNSTIIMLTVFTKQTTKTPLAEISKAKKLLKDFQKRSDLK